jgi:hypothetical protein
MKLAGVFHWGLVCALLAGCGPRGPIRPHTNLREGDEPLRSAFNADSGRVRAIALASPT